LEALLANVTLPLAAPLAAGLKVTVKEAFDPAAIVVGNDIPLTVNSGLSELTPVT
jgi:hypothetical protein